MTSDQPKPGIYLIVDFDWPSEITKEIGGKAYQLHAVVQDKLWIKEVVAASGGVGAGPSSHWTFWLEDYAALGRLLTDQDDEVSQAYSAFFSVMPRVEDKVREQVLFG